MLLTKRVPSSPFPGPRQPIWLSFRSSTWFICTIIFIATFTDGVAYGAIVPILPFSLVARSGVPENEVPFWISTLLVAHGAAMALASPIAGWLADRGTSRKKSFFSGIALLFGATLMFTLGTGPVMLVAARCLQGASAGIVYTVGLALLVDTVGRDQLGAWMGSTLSGMSAGVMISPFIAGMIYAAAGYYAVFIILLAVIGFVFMLPIIMIEKKTAEKWLKVKNAETNYGTFSDEPDEDHKPDVRPGIPTTDQYKSNPKDTEAEEGTEHQCPSPENLEDNESDAGFDKTLNPEKGLTRHLKTMVVLMKSPGIVAAMYGGFVQVALICAFDGILPFFVKKTFDWNSSGAGSIFLAITVPSLAAPLVGTLSDRIGARVIVLAGFAISTLALALLSLVGHNSLSQVILLCALLVMTGIGTTLMLSPLAADMFHIVTQMGKDHYMLFGPGGAYAQAYGLFDTALALGVMFGPAFAGLLYEKGGWNVAVWGLAIFCSSGVVPVMLFTGKSRKKMKKDKMGKGGTEHA